MTEPLVIKGEKIAVIHDRRDRKEDMTCPFHADTEKVITCVKGKVDKMYIWMIVLALSTGSSVALKIAEFMIKP